MGIPEEKKIEYRKKLIKFLILLVLVAGIGLFLRYGSRLENLEIKGCTYYEEEALRSWLCDSIWDNQTWYLYLKLRFGEAPSIPFIEEIEVDFVDLHTLRIGVYEKEIVGCIPYMGEYVCFDKDGIMVGSVIEHREEIPEVTGIQYDKIIYNEKVDTPRSELFEIVLNITQLIHKFDLPVTEIHFNHELSVTLYTEDISILLGIREQYDEPLSALPGILVKAEGMHGTLNMLDFSEKNQKVIFIKEDTGKK